MYQMCPWCLKNGIKSKIKAYQINLKEAVWLCETTDVSNSTIDEVMEI